MKKKNLLLFIVAFGILAFSINVYAESCEGVFSDGLIEALDKYLYVPIKWLTPIVLLLLTSIDFFGIIFNGEKDKLNKAKNNFLKRLIAAVIIFFAPNLISLIVRLVNDQSISSCMNNF